jgi:cobalt-zinc-cadmium efflux system outer membrane protein
VEICLGFDRGSLLFPIIGALIAALTARPAWAWPPLDAVWRAAREHAPASVAAQSETARARADGTLARTSSLDNPVVQFNADHGVGRTPAGASSGLVMTGIVGLPIEIAGQRSARIRAADARLAWKEREQTATEGSAGAAAIEAYGRAVVARARVEQAARAEDQARDELTWFEARTAAGDATAVDRSLAQTELARHAQVRAEAEIDLVGAQADLRALTGLPDVDDPPVDAAGGPPSRRGGASAARSLASSPRLEAYAREQSYWGEEVEASKARRWAPLQVIVTGGQDEFGQVRLGGGLGWSLPLIRRSDGEIARATTSMDRARREREEVGRALEAVAHGLTEQLARTDDAVVALDRTGIPAAERLVQATDAAFRAGKLELVRVLNARRDLALLRTRRLDLVEGSWRAYGELAAILGVLP